MAVKDFELVPADVLYNALPDEEQVGEVTGNEGATLDRTYHSVALVLFKSAGIFDELVNYSVHENVSAVASELYRNDGIFNDYIIELVQCLIKAWLKCDIYYRYSKFLKFSELLIKLDDYQTLREFMGDPAIWDYSDFANDAFASVLAFCPCSV